MSAFPAKLRRRVPARPVARRAGALGIAALGAAAALVLSGCALVSRAQQVRHDVQANRNVIREFAAGLRSGTAAPFAVTYVTTGGAPTTVTYAVRPPREIAFRQRAAGGSSLDLVTNATGEYSCTGRGGAAGGAASSGWACQKLGRATAAAQNALVGLYTPAHWITFLTGLSIAAGLTGQKVTSSTMTVHGFTLRCVGFRVRHVAGTSTICSTAAGILGYVKVAGNPTSFEIRSYTPSPPARLFRVPAGATVTPAAGA